MCSKCLTHTAVATCVDKGALGGWGLGVGKDLRVKITSQVWPVGLHSERPVGGLALSMYWHAKCHTRITNLWGALWRGSSNLVGTWGTILHSLPFPQGGVWELQRSHEICNPCWEGADQLLIFTYSEWIYWVIMNHQMLDLSKIVFYWLCSPNSALESEGKC